MISKHTILAEWFLDTRYPHLPCLWLGKIEYLPMELCEIVKGQQVFCQMEKEEKTNMIRHSTMKPPERFKKIEDFVRIFIGLIFRKLDA